MRNLWIRLLTWLLDKATPVAPQFPENPQLPITPEALKTATIILAREERLWTEK